MVRTFQLTKALARLTVIENMRSAPPARRGEQLLRGALQVRCGATQEREITERGRRPARRGSSSTTCATSSPAALSGGQRKLLEMARALMTDPTLIMLDEPMAGVNPALKQSLLEHIKALQGRGAHGAVRRARHGHGPRHQRLGAS